MDRFFPFRAQRITARLRLVCFPYAGSGASLFRNWDHLLPDWIDVCAFELPGRGTRFGEPPIDDMTVLRRHIVDAMLQAIDPPVALFGHSMGARIAFEVAGCLPFGVTHLFVSASPSPENGMEPRISRLRSPEFITAIQGLGGTPTALLEEPGAMETFEPVLRADFHLAESHSTSAKKSTIPITAFGGTEDSSVPISTLAGWAQFTSGPFRLFPVQGDHFFLTSGYRAITRVISETLAGSEQNSAARL